MNNNFGEILKITLEERGITPYKLSQMTDISKGHIYKILKDMNEPSLYVLNDISKILKVDMNEYYKISRDFNSLEEYESYKKIRVLIEDKADIEGIEIELAKIDLSNIRFGIYNQLINYSKGLVMCKKYKNYRKSLEFCLKALNTKVLVLHRLEKYIISEISFAVLSLTEYNYFLLGKTEDAKKVAYEMSIIIEMMYFNKATPKIVVPKIIFRSYIILTNNLADIHFNEKNYIETINYCDKGIAILKSEHSMYGLRYLYDLLFQAYYFIDKFEEANKYYENAKAVCIISNDLDYLIKMEERIEKNYPKLK